MEKEKTKIMKCPLCDQEIPGIACSQCGTSVPFGANYCMECGALLDMPASAAESGDDELDFENRILCPDGRCTGIIADGKCIECGKEYKGN